jgi:1-deoxyxylulose-5-phosphate synthase
LETDQFGKNMYTPTEEADRQIIDRLGQLAEKHGASRAQLALAWMLSKPAVVSPIVGATKPNHLKDAVAALSVTLTPEEITSLEEPYTPHTILGHS